MKFAYTTLSILVTLLFVSGCSENKPDKYESNNTARNVVRKAIQKPDRKAQDLLETKKEITEIVNKDIDERIRQETIKEQPPADETNIYITKAGDTLWDISGKTEIYKNPLKWPLLYRDNPEKLAAIKNKDDLYETKLPAGLKFKIIPEEEIEKNLEDRHGSYYVANLISSPYMKEIASQVVKLIDAGYFVYISSTMIDGKEWYRLRAGFYKSRSEANREGDRIKKHLKIPDIWTAKIGDEEFSTFGGY